MQNGQFYSELIKMQRIFDVLGCVKRKATEQYYVKSRCHLFLSFKRQGRRKEQTKFDCFIMATRCRNWDSRERGKRVKQTVKNRRKGKEILTKKRGRVFSPLFFEICFYLVAEVATREAKRRGVMTYDPLRMQS